MKMKPNGSQCWQASADYSEREFDVRPEEHRRSIIDDIVWVLDVFVRDGVRSNHAGDAYSAYTVLSAMNITLRFLYDGQTYAAPRVSINITANFFFASIFTLSTIGMGRTSITRSAKTSVN
jgi:hypothetical protein